MEGGGGGGGGGLVSQSIIHYDREGVGLGCNIMQETHKKGNVLS